MTWGRYSSEPRNGQMTALDVIKSPNFAPAVLNAVQDPRLRGYLVDKSVPWDAVDLPLVTSLPRQPKDRAEVNYLIDETNEVVVRMVYRAATGNWVQVGAIPVVTSLPSVTTEGFQIVYDTDTSGVRWHLVYDTTDGTTYPWLFIGGPALSATNTGTTMTTTSTSYVDLSTVGPSLTAPLAGEYRANWWFQAQHDTASGVGYMAIKNGSAATSDTNSVRGQAAGINYDILCPNGSQVITVSAASTVLKAQYRTLSGTLTVNNAGTLNPWMTVQPVRVV